MSTIILFTAGESDQSITPVLSQKPSQCCPVRIRRDLRPLIGARPIRPNWPSRGWVLASGGRVQIEGPVGPSELMAILQRVLEEQGAMLVAARADEEERLLNRRLREEQDAAYQAALLEDQVQRLAETQTTCLGALICGQIQGCAIAGTICPGELPWERVLEHATCRRHLHRGEPCDLAASIPSCSSQAVCTREAGGCPLGDVQR